MTLTIQSIDTRETWNAEAARFADAHILQSWEWGDFKHLTTGWQPMRLAFQRGSETVALASIGVRKAGPLKVMYAPKGPLMDYGNLELSAQVLDALEGVARRERAVTLKIDPDIPHTLGAPDTGESPDPRGVAWQNLLARRGWVYSREQIQFKNTIIIDLTPEEDALLMGISQNTRRKVRVAERAGVTVRAATPADLPVLIRLYQETGRRDGFLIRPQEYYERAWRDFMQAGRAHVLIAESGGVEIAHVVLYAFGETCWYFYGASSDLHREKMPNYLLQWEAMRWAKAHGCTRYDLWGAPDIFDESDGMWGVYQFKRGFRGTVHQHIGAYDFAPNRLLYNVFTEVLPRARSLVRRTRHRREAKD